MALTISHCSALELTRQLRSQGMDLRNDLDDSSLKEPRLWKGIRWTMQEFSLAEWRWPQPEKHWPLHVLVSQRHRGAIRMRGAREHLCGFELPARAVLWLDEHATVVGPDLLFVQMAETMSLPSLVLLGYELCGGYSRDAMDPRSGDARLNIALATKVGELSDFLQRFKSGRRPNGLRKAQHALDYVCDNAASPAEALLAMLYSPPSKEGGYGMGPVTINKRVPIREGLRSSDAQNRYPDLVFPFAKVGLNYEGGNHLNLTDVVRTQQMAALADPGHRPSAMLEFARAVEAVRAKSVDDARRDRELASEGTLVLRVTKEDLYGSGVLDRVTAQVLACARWLCSDDAAGLEAALADYEETLLDFEHARERAALIASVLPGVGKQLARGAL